MSDRHPIPATDEELVLTFQRDPSGDSGRAAAEELFERYWERVYLWCLRRIGNRETARDLAQDVLLSAYRALGSFEGRSRYSSWLFTIMRNRCFRALRRPSLVRDEEFEVESMAGDATPADADLAEREDEEEVLRLIRTQLDPLEQAALWLRARERLPVEEITRRLRISTASGARGVLQSGRRKLRAALDRRQQEGGDRLA
jgi:RNA polymerase sigma-70 factor (ECF subfamily)